MKSSGKIHDKTETAARNILAECVEAYYCSVGINVAFIDEAGTTDFLFGKTPAFCGFRQALEGLRSECGIEHLKGSLEAEKLGEEYIFSCSSGLVHFVAPIVRDRVFCGALVAGPILMEYADDTLVEQVIAANGLTIKDKGKVQILLREIPVFEPAQVRHLARLLFYTACAATSTGNHELKERKQRSEQQAQIGAGIQTAKERGSASACYPYEYEQEKEFLLKVRAGDVIGAKAILNELLGVIFFHTGGNIELIKARLLELCTLLSRAAVEGGAELQKIFGMNYGFIGELSKLKTLEALSFWILKVLDTFTENIFYISDAKNIEIIQKAVNYVNDNIDGAITLDMVAEQVHLNPSYFSTIFKKETGVGFSDYLNKVRIEKSKSLLKDRRYSILDIALMVGFEDQSYYSRVFRKFTGMTPKDYRNK